MLRPMGPDHFFPANWARFFFGKLGPQKIRVRQIIPKPIRPRKIYVDCCLPGPNLQKKRKKADRAPKSVGYKLLPNEQGAQFAWIQSAEHNFPRTTNWILINSSFIYYSYASFPFKIQVYARRSRKYFGTLTQSASKDFGNQSISTQGGRSCVKA